MICTKWICLFQSCSWCWFIWKWENK